MEIVLRSVVVFLFLWGLLRALGKRELAEMTAFELVLLVVLGDLVQQGVTQEDMSLTGAALAVGTMGLLAVGTSVLSRRSGTAERIVEGRPSVVVRDGRILYDVLRLQRMTEDEVLEAARKQGYLSLDDLAWVIVESDGKLSLIPRPSDRSGSDGDGGGGGGGDAESHDY